MARAIVLGQLIRGNGDLLRREIVADSRIDIVTSMLFLLSLLRQERKIASF